MPPGVERPNWLARLVAPTSSSMCAVSRNKLKMISADPTAIVSGEAERQDLGPFSNASLRGNYGFLLKGFSATTWDGSLARFTADGEGGISGGLADLNSSETVTEDAPFTGTYEVSSNGRGHLALDAWPGGMQGTFYLVSGGRGKFVQLSPTSALGGVLEMQQPMTFAPTSLAEAFGFSLAGFAANQPATYWGDLLTDGAGATAGRDFSRIGRSPMGLSSSGTYTISPDGRGIILEVSGAGMPRRAFVALSPSRLMMVTLDSATMAGYAEGQARLLQKINDGGIVNSADLREGGGGGTIMTLFGKDLAPVTTVAESFPLPTTLAGVQVLVSGVAAPLHFVSPEQINFQIPWNASLSGGVVVANGDERGLPQFPSVQREPAPAIFTLSQSGGGQGAIVIAATGEVAAPSGSVSGSAARPARPGEFVVIYCTGLGPVSNPPLSGAPAFTDRLSPTPSTPLVSIGSRAAWVTFSGLVPGFVGLYQVNVQVPSDVSSGDAVPVQMVMPGSTTYAYAPSNVVTIAVRP